MHREKSIIAHSRPPPADYEAFASLFSGVFLNIGKRTRSDTLSPIFIQQFLDGSLIYLSFDCGNVK
jgi:hypothetical protein